MIPKSEVEFLKWRDVTVHFDSSTSHTAGETVKWLKANKIKFIPAEKWTPNSPEVSPMDFFGNGYLKSLIKKRHYKTFEGMIRCAKEEWLNIPLEMFQKALSSWSDRLLKIHKARGHYVPQ